MEQRCEARRGRVEDIKWWKLSNRSCSARTVSVLQRLNQWGVLCHIIAVTSFGQLTNASRFQSYFNTIHSHYPTSGWGFLDPSNPRRCVVHHVCLPPIETVTGYLEPTLAAGFSTPPSLGNPTATAPNGRTCFFVLNLFSPSLSMTRPGIESGGLSREEVGRLCHQSEHQPARSWPNHRSVVLNTSEEEEKSIRPDA